jgi:hypothetical protein
MKTGNRTPAAATGTRQAAPEDNPSGGKIVKEENTSDWRCILHLTGKSTHARGNVENSGGKKYCPDYSGGNDQKCKSGKTSLTQALEKQAEQRSGRATGIRRE